MTLKFKTMDTLKLMKGMAIEARENIKTIQQGIDLLDVDLKPDFHERLRQLINWLTFLETELEAMSAQENAE